MTFGEIWSLFKSIELTEITTGAVRSTPVAGHAKHTHSHKIRARALAHAREPDVVCSENNAGGGRQLDDVGDEDAFAIFRKI